MTALALVAALALAGCSSPIALEPAEFATDPRCADVIVNLPGTLGDFELLETNAQGTAAWGDGTAALILKCGVPVPDPTSALPCVDAGGIDWLVDDSQDPRFYFTTYGRDPAVQVLVDYDVASGSLLQGLANAISFTTRESGCIGLEDVVPAD